MNFSYRRGRPYKFFIESQISHSNLTTHMNFSHTAAHPYEFLIQTQSPVRIFYTKPITYMNFRSDGLWLLSNGFHETRKRETVRLGHMGLSVTVGHMGLSVTLGHMGLSVLLGHMGLSVTLENYRFICPLIRLRAERTGVWNPERATDSIFSKTPRPTLGPTQSPLWVPGFSPGCKAARAWS
jgi:hypothetical protein